MAPLIDRRLDGRNKSAVNRRRFIRRYRGQLKKAVADAMAGRSITDMDQGERVRIPSKDISEPSFGLAPGGKRQIIHPGNREFVTGDRVKRPQSGGASGSKGSNSGEGEDDFEPLASLLIVQPCIAARSRWSQKTFALPKTEGLRVDVIFFRHPGDHPILRLRLHISPPTNLGLKPTKTARTLRAASTIIPVSANLTLALKRAGAS